MDTRRDTEGFADALFRGRLLRPETLAAMTTFGSEGYGLGVARKPTAPDRRMATRGS